MRYLYKGLEVNFLSKDEIWKKVGVGQASGEEPGRPLLLQVQYCTALEEEEKKFLENFTQLNMKMKL